MGEKNLLCHIFGFILHKTFTLFMMLFFIAILSGCEELIVVNGIEPTINFQEGTIEGVKTGDDTTTVIQKLGRPDWIGWGDFDGFIFMYKSNSQPGLARLQVSFVNLHNYDSLVEPHTYLVFDIVATQLYLGRSKEGIGIGTQKQIVRYFLGTPSKYSDSTNDDFIIELERGLKVIKHFYAFSYDDHDFVKRIGIILNFRKTTN